MVDLKEEDPPEGLLERGFVPPFRKWLQFDQDYPDMDGDFESIPPIYCRNTEVPCDVIAYEIRKNGPYDGILGFSQGAVMGR